MNNVVCFGEVLWDKLPSGKKPGGAPMNVAYHLRQLGMNSKIVSRVGKDPLGEELLNFLTRIGLSTDNVQVDPEHDTSQVIATASPSGEMSYDIVSPVAWDFIDYDERTVNEVKNADMFVYGSLVARNEHTRDSLYKLIEHAQLKLFDVNLRAPHYEFSTINDLLEAADIVKMNEHEIVFIGNWLGSSSDNEQKLVELIQTRYQIREIILTKGADGASYYTLNERYDYKAYPVMVKDTIGSGDSFLAAFIRQKLLNFPVEEMLDFASALGAFVTSHAGANPEYDFRDLARFIWEKQLERANWK